MKKIRTAVFFFVLTVCLLFAHTTNAQAAIKLNKTSLSLVEGKSATLKLTGTKKKIIWKSNKKSVATVTQKGKVTAKAPGNAVISATVGKTTKKCKVTVSVDYAKSYEYQIKYGKVTINKLLRISEENLTMPETIEGYPVTELADGLFKGCDGLVSITLPSQVTRIGNDTFYGCKMLREIKTEGTINALGAYAFYDCNVLETIPEFSGIDSIGDYAFYNCDALTMFVISTDLKTIGNYAFYDCDKLLTFFAPDSLLSIGDHAFENCDLLLGFNGCKNLLTIGTECFKDCKQLGTVSLGNKLTTLGRGCFMNCEKLSSVSFSSTLTAIPDRCFYNCYAISNITIPISVTKIGNMAFYNCIRLAILTVPGTGITSIATDSFAGVPMTNLSIYYRPSSPAGYFDNWVTGLSLPADHIHSI